MNILGLIIDMGLFAYFEILFLDTYFMQRNIKNIVEYFYKTEIVRLK